MSRIRIRRAKRRKKEGGGVQMFERMHEWTREKDQMKEWKKVKITSKKSARKKDMAAKGGTREENRNRRKEARKKKKEIKKKEIVKEGAKRKQARTCNTQLNK